MCKKCVGKMKAFEREKIRGEKMSDRKWSRWEQAGFCSLSVPIWLHTRAHPHILLVFNMGLDVISSFFLSRGPQDIKSTNSYKKPLHLVPPTKAYFSYLFNPFELFYQDGQEMNDSWIITTATRHWWKCICKEGLLF